MIPFLEEAARVCPSQRQLDWLAMENYAFAHFGMNTFTNREWGNGKENPQKFNPQKLDCDQWVEAIKSAGLKGLILTAKHHDGFCLWPSKYTEHSVKNSPCKRDIVREAAAACRRGGIKFGVYLSPWDRNSQYYGTPEYNDYFCNQLTELLTNYGELFCVWFDNACGEGKNGKKQEYDFPRYIDLIRKYQPNAVIFNDYGPDTRWCGNEAGSPRYSEWAVMPTELCKYAEIQTGPGPLAQEGQLDFLYNAMQNLGTLPGILYSKGLTFVPSEIDVSIRKGWFWHPGEEPKPLEELFQIYLTSVGGNAGLNLNVPPTTDGLIDSRDVARLKDLGGLIRHEFGHPLPCSIEKLPGYPATQPRYRVTLEKPCRNLKYVALRENIAEGQRVEEFRIFSGEETKFAMYDGTVIGNKKICALRDPFAHQNPLTSTFHPQIKSIDIQITAARGAAAISEISLYADAGTYRPISQPDSKKGFFKRLLGNK